MFKKVLKAFTAISFLFLSPIHATGDSNMPATQKNPVVVFETNQGTFEVTLNPQVAPKTCENFLGLVQKGYYNGITFHRVIKGFMIQGGDPTGTGAGGQSIWNKNFEDEFSPSVKFDHKGVLAMANRGPNTNGSQFFITTAPTPWLDQKHTIFGEVTSGYDVVEKIETTKTGPRDAPVEPQKIIKAYVKAT
jgi:peptidylprolyl isomerase